MIKKTTITSFLRNNPFAKNVSVLVGGTASAQLLTMLAAPLLTRLYTPEDFGVLAVYSALLAFYSIVSSLRYELAIPIQENSREAKNILVLCLAVVLIMTLLSGLMVSISGSYLARILGVPELDRFFWLLPVGVFLAGSYNVFHYWAIRSRDFASIAQTNIFQSVTTILLQIGGAMFGAVSLVVGQAGGQGAGILRLAKPVLRQQQIFDWCPSEIWQAAKKHYRFPLFSTWSALFNTAGTQIPPVMFSVLFGSSAAGLYALAHRVLSVPISVLGGAVGNVFLSKAADAIRSREISSLIESIHRNLSEVSLPFILLLMLAAPEIFAFLFGESWRLAGTIAAWLAPFLYIQFITSPISTLHTVVGKQAKGMLLHGVLLFVRVLSIMIGAIYGDLLLSVALFSLSSAVCWLAFLLWLLRLAGCDPLKVFARVTIKALSSSVVVLSPLFLIYAFNNELTVVLLSFFLFVLFYFARLFLLFRPYLVKC